MAKRTQTIRRQRVKPTLTTAIYSQEHIGLLMLALIESISGSLEIFSLLQISFNVSWKRRPELNSIL